MLTHVPPVFVDLQMNTFSYQQSTAASILKWPSVPVGKYAIQPRSLSAQSASREVLCRWQPGWRTRTGSANSGPPKLGMFASFVALSASRHLARRSNRLRMRSLSTDTDVISRTRLLIQTFEKKPPEWYQALEMALVGTAVACFCYAESVPSQAQLFAADPYFSYASGYVSLEDVINTFFIVEFLLRAWANKFRLEWLTSQKAIVDFLSCLPILDRAFLLTPGPDLMFQLDILRSLRMLRIVRCMKPITTSTEDGPPPLGLVIIKVAVTVVGTMSIAASLLWRVEGRNGQNPNMKSLSDAFYYALNVMTSQGAPWPAVSRDGKLITSLGIVIGLVTVPVAVGELITTLGLRPRKDPLPEDASADAQVKGISPAEAPSLTQLCADVLVELESDSASLSVVGFCAEAGVDVSSLDKSVLHADVADVFTLLEDPSTAGFVSKDPLVQIKLAAALVRRKRRLSETSFKKA
eukprot:TRINITY_DN40653_c0_g1_i1.p1 TRINITY_DN40653_c0_g1~~TRINITY_DN40653_c0_g1_i1.p1  ORF type:complete len:466 (+),score=83.34 TRINITY_DN40653_c0_g1_i1:19-1416(+)